MRVLFDLPDGYEWLVAISIGAFLLALVVVARFITEA